MKITFRIDIFDKDGDVNEEGLFVYFGEKFILKFKDPSELNLMIVGLQACQKEIADTGVFL